MIEIVSLLASHGILLILPSFPLHAFVDNIRDGDVILTFGSSPVLRGVLLHAATVRKRNFSLVVVDSLPLHEGVRTLAALSPFIQCTYSPMAGASRAMKDATRVLLGEFLKSN